MAAIAVAGLPPVTLLGKGKKEVDLVADVWRRLRLGLKCQRSAGERPQALGVIWTALGDLHHADSRHSWFRPTCMEHFPVLCTATRSARFTALSSSDFKVCKIVKKHKSTKKMKIL